MIFIRIGPTRIAVLEPANIVDLKAGEVIYSVDKSVVIAYTPDVLFMEQELKKIVDVDSTLSPADFDKVHKASMLRPERIQRPYHETKNLKDGKSW